MNCNNPYNTNMGMVEPTNMQGMGYTNMPMGYPSNMGYMANPNMYGAGYGNMMMPPTSSCNQVVQKCFVEEIPYYVGYNTHVVNNVVRRHIQIPVYSQTQQTVYFDEWQTGCGCGR